MSLNERSKTARFPGEFTPEQWARMTLEERARANNRTPQQQAEIEEFHRGIGQSLVDNLNANVKAQDKT